MTPITDRLRVEKFGMYGSYVVSLHGARLTISAEEAAALVAALTPTPARTTEEEQDDLSRQSSPCPQSGTGSPRKPQPDGAEQPRIAICERCQMRLPERLVTFGIGVRGGAAARCAACAPQPGPDGEANRAEVIAIRNGMRA